MQQSESSTTRPWGQTGGSGERSPRQVSPAVGRFDLPREIDGLRGEATWRQGDRDAKTLLKDCDLRVVLTALKAGAVLKEHQVPGPATIHLLAGRIALRLPDRTVELSSGQLLTLDGDLRHDVEAIEESAFLVTIAWPAGPRGDTAR